MSTTESQNAPQQLPGITGTTSVLATILVAIAGILFQASDFFDPGGVWDTASGSEQVLIGLIVCVAFLLSVLAVSKVLALIFFCISRRWPHGFWKTMVKKFLTNIKGVIPYTVVHRGTLDELRCRPVLQQPRETSGTPGKGRVGRPPTRKVRYGELYTMPNVNNGTLRVYWENGKGIGTLNPSRGNGWDVVYGQFEGSVQNEFRPIAPLGRADSQREGVEMLRERDLSDL